MAENIREYRIKINGLEESQQLVEALVDKLIQLETKLNALSSTTINISGNVTTTETTRGGGGRRNTEELSTEERLLEQIEKIQQRIEEARNREYENLVNQKQILKDTRKEMESSAAQQRLEADNYGETLNGLRAKLVDLKKVIGGTNTTDEGFEKLIAEANVLNDRIKAIEQSYGVFGRNVGNYTNSIIEALSTIKISVNGTDREFGSAREASRELGNELKSMALNGKQGTKEFQELQKIVLQLDSALKDATKSSVAMDNMLDMVQGFTALGSVTQGFSSLFGVDNSAIEEQIKTLVSLQNVLQGIEQIRQQMMSQEGLGGVLSKGSDKIDKFVNKLFGVSEATSGVTNATSAATNATSAATTALNGETAAAGAATTANVALTASAKAATIATKALSVALKAIGIGVVIGLVSLLIDGIKELFGWIKEWVNGDDELIDTERMLQSTLDTTNEKLDERIDRANRAEKAGFITQSEKQVEIEQAYAEAIKETVDVLKERAKGLKENESEDFGKSFLTGIEMSKKGLNEFTQSEEDALEKYKLFEDAVVNGKSLWKEYGYSVDDVKENMVRLQRGAIGQMIREFSNLTGNVEKDREELLRLSNLLKNNALWKGALANAENIIDDEGVRQRLEAMQSYLMKFQKTVTDEDQQFWEDIRKSNEEASGKQLTAAQERLKREEEHYKEHYDTMSDEQRRQAETGIANQKKLVEKEGRELRNKRNQEARKTLDAVNAIYNNLENLEIRLMQDGLAKRLRQLELNRKKEIQALKGNAAQIAEQTKRINEIYQEEEYKANLDHFNRMINLQTSYYNQINNLRRENLEQSTTNTIERGQIDTNVKSRVNEGRYYINDLFTKDLTIDYSTINNDLDKFIKKSSDLRKAYDDAIYDVRSYYISVNKELVEYEKQLQNIDVEIQRVTGEYERFVRADVEFGDDVPKIEDAITRYSQLVVEIKQQIADAIDAGNNNVLGELYGRQQNITKIIANLESFNVKLKELKDSGNALKNDIREKYKVSFDDIDFNDNYVTNNIEDLNKAFDIRYNARKEYYDRINELNRQQAKLELDQEQARLKAIFDMEKKAYDDDFHTKYGNMDKYGNGFDYEDGYMLNLSASYAVQLENGDVDAARETLNRLQKAYEDYYAKAKEELRSYQNDLQNGLITEDEYIEKQKDFFEKTGGELAQQYQKGEVTFSDFINTQQQMFEQYTTHMINMEDKFNNDMKKADEDYYQTIRSSSAAYYDQYVKEFEDFSQELNNRVQNLPKVDSFGIVNISETRKAYKEQIDAYTNMLEQIKQKSIDLTYDVSIGNISVEEYDAAIRQLNGLEQNAKESITRLNTNLKDVYADFLESITKWAQFITQSFQGVLSEWNNYQNMLLDEEEDYLDEQNKILDEKLQEQEDIVQKHKDNMSSIEDELATARGDRRDFLIDQLNEEIAAQRRAYAEQQRIEKEKEKNEEKLKDLEYEREVQNWKSSLNQAIISQALAIANAFATKPFVPVGIAMGSIASIATAAQIALIEKQRPKKKYADGGLLDGNSHAQGGIQVGNTNIEVEGKEYVINKTTTTKNIDLLEYINHKRKKLELEDLVDFFSDKKHVSKVISNKKFANGGQLPNVSGIDNNKPIIVRNEGVYQVSVVDIINKTEDVNRIRVMAGEV